jgi:hypothetical protein
MASPSDPGLVKSRFVEHAQQNDFSQALGNHQM